MKASMGVVISPDASEQPVLRAAITAFTAASKEVVAAVSGFKIRVLSYFLCEAAGGTAEALNWEDGTTDISGVFTPAAGTPIVGPWNPHGHFETSAGNALNITKSSTTISVAGYLTYQLVSTLD